MFRTLCCVVARIALAADCCCCWWWSIHRVRRRLIDDSKTKYRNLLETVVSCSPGINRRYRVIGIFLTISLVRHSNRRYSSIVKNRDLLHKYLVVPITTYTYDRQTQVNCNKGNNRKDREERKGIVYFDSRSPCVTSRSSRPFIALICCWQYIDYIMAVSIPGHDDLTGLLMIQNGLIVTLWAPTA